MLDSFFIASTGMHGQQQLVEMISNNIANLNTMGFKKTTAQFVDLLQNPLMNKQNVNKAQGVSILEMSPVFAQGDFKQTGNMFDVAIDGSGFFELMTPDGDLIYSRNGSFQTDEEGFLISAQGNYLKGMIQIPPSAEQVVFSENGDVYITESGLDKPQLVGNIELVQFMNVKGLKAMGGGLYQPTAQSGDAQYIDLVESGDRLLQHYLESSNVDMVQELTNLVLAQRAYGLNSRVIQVSDEMMGVINSLRR